jgi:hypothetical protein
MRIYTTYFIFIFAVSSYWMLCDMLYFLVSLIMEYFAMHLYRLVLLCTVPLTYRRMEEADTEQQQSVLNWMQILCQLGVTIPLDILYSMFTTGLHTTTLLKGPEVKYHLTHKMTNTLHNYSVMLHLWCICHILFTKWQMRFTATLSYKYASDEASQDHCEAYLSFCESNDTLPEPISHETIPLKQEMSVVC